MDNPFVTLLVGAALAMVASTLAHLTEVFRQKWTVRHETANWRRETMFRVAHEYVEAAFKMAGISGNARRERIAGGSLQSLQGHLDECHQVHRSMTDSLSALRLLAPRNVVVSAEAVHDSCHVLINLAMGIRSPNSDDETSDGAWELKKRSARTDRSNLVVAVRAVFGIETDAVPFGARVESSWTVPADVPAS